MRSLTRIVVDVSNVEDSLASLSDTLIKINVRSSIQVQFDVVSKRYRYVMTHPFLFLQGRPFLYKHMKKMNKRNKMFVFKLMMMMMMK